MRRSRPTLAWVAAALAVGCGRPPVAVAPAAQQSSVAARHWPIRSNPSTNPARSSVDVAIDDDGSYTLTDADTGWAFTGRLPRPVANRRTTAGADALGRYTAVTADTADDVGPLAVEVRTYADRPVVLFRWTTPASRPSPPAAFPAVSVPADLHTFSYGDAAFGTPDFHGHGGGTPWLLFDDDGHAAVLSPASDFLTSDVRRTDDGGVASDLNVALADLPAGYTHASVLAFGDGIADAWSAWGHALTDLAGKRRPANDADVGLAKLGYWTYTGASYY